MIQIFTESDVYLKHCNLLHVFCKSTSEKKICSMFEKKVGFFFLLITKEDKQFL